MNLRTFSVVFVFTSEVLAFKSIEDLGDGFGRLRQHGLQRYPRLQLAILAEVKDSMLKHSWNDHFITREFACGISDTFKLVELRLTCIPSSVWLLPSLAVRYWATSCPSFPSHG